MTTRRPTTKLHLTDTECTPKLPTAVSALLEFPMRCINFRVEDDISILRTEIRGFLTRAGSRWPRHSSVATDPLNLAISIINSFTTLRVVVHLVTCTVWAGWAASETLSPQRYTAMTTICNDQPLHFLRDTPPSTVWASCDCQTIVTLLLSGHGISHLAFNGISRADCGAVFAKSGAHDSRTFTSRCRERDCVETMWQADRAKRNAAPTADVRYDRQERTATESEGGRRRQDDATHPSTRQ